METTWSLHEYWNDDAFGTSWDSAQQMVANGEAAMCIHGSWAVDGISSYNPDINLGVFPMPVSENPEEALMIKEPGQQLVLYNFEDEATKEAARDLYKSDLFSGFHEGLCGTGTSRCPSRWRAIIDTPSGTG